MNLTGLTEKQVQEKIKQGKVNQAPRKNQNTVGKIILQSSLTIFNLVNLILALMIILVGAYKNLLFLLVAIANTLISIINGIRAKRTVDKMRLIAEQKPTVIRDGETRQIQQDQIVEGDLLVYSIGNQIVVDSKVEQGSIEVNESYITGEQDNITKRPGDKLTSGSFVVSGSCKATATAVGVNNFINKLEGNARTIKTAESKLFKIINNIVKYVSYALIPIGALLLWSRFRVGDTTTEIAVTSTVAGLISMIPEGLVLLTSSVLALATIRLSRKQVLVQDLYSIETLARVDAICLDKTGTLTTGKMTVRHFIPVKNKKLLDATDLKNPEPTAEKSLQNALKLILSSQEADNATSTALKAKLLKHAKFEPTEQIIEVIPFSSDRKYSGVVTNKATYLMGALEFITEDESLLELERSLDGNSRIISVVKYAPWTSDDRVSSESSDRKLHGRATDLEGAPRNRLSILGEEKVRQNPSRDKTTGPVEKTASTARPELTVPVEECTLLGFALLEDEIRNDAKEIIGYFYKNDVDVKIISGDNLQTVQSIALQTGVQHADKAIDLSTIKQPNYEKLVQDYTIFTRVKPAEKKNLINALQKLGKTVAMTGDGVNDILAMKEANVSIAIGEGADAARRSAKLVLLNSGFESVPSIIDEGRQSINNLERSATLFLSKNTFAAILAVLFIIIAIESPYAPLEMSILNFACIGFPGVILALEKNTARIKNRFLKNILQFSVPTGITVSLSMIVLAFIANVNDYSRPELLTSSFIITFAIDFLLILAIARPLNILRTVLLIFICAVIFFALAIPPIRDFLDFTPLSPDKILVVIAIIAVAYILFAIFRFSMHRFTDKIIAHHPRLNL